MDIEELIKETFAEHEHVVPDEDAVLAAARERIDRRRTVLSRPLVVAAGVVALTLAAVTVVALNRSGPTDEVAADRAQSTVPVSSDSTQPAIADLAMPYALGWLPPGEVDYVARRINIGGTAEEPETPVYNGEYMVTVTADGQVLDIDVQQMKQMPVAHAAFKSGAGNPVTINGQPGIESAHPDGPSGYELYLAHPDGGSMYVGVSVEYGSTASAQQLVDVGHEIARNIRFPGTATVTPLFGLGELPAGMRICAFDVEKGFGLASDGSDLNTSYSLGTCATRPPIHVYVANTDDATGTPGQPVQGRETRYADENGYSTLWVLDSVDGAPVAVAGKVPLADLYDIANRLVLPSS